MERNEIIKQLGEFFKVEELVCPHIYKKFKDNSWRFLDTNYLHCLLILRKDIFQAPMTCTTKAMTQRGMRCNMCDLVKSKKEAYISSHLLGKAGDFDVKGLTAAEARQKVKDNADQLPCKCRIEADVNWLHFDVMPHDQDSNVYVFEG